MQLPSSSENMHPNLNGFRSIGELFRVFQDIEGETLNVHACLLGRGRRGGPLCCHMEVWWTRHQSRLAVHSAGKHPQLAVHCFSAFLCDSPTHTKGVWLSDHTDAHLYIILSLFSKRPTQSNIYLMNILQCWILYSDRFEHGCFGVYV